jgi:hypothetical protein
MTELEKYQRVNKCETPEDIYQCIRDFSENGEIQGRIRKFDSEKMIANAELFFKGYAIPNVITREFGLRQQCMYINHYLKLKI